MEHVDRRFNNAPCSDRETGALAAMTVPSDHLYQIAALTFVLFLLVTMF